MNEICKNCGKTIDNHFPYVMDGKIAMNYCYRNGKKQFTRSGRVAVPVELVEAMKRAILAFGDYTSASSSYVGYKRLRLKARKSMADVGDMLSALDGKAVKG